jgi:hypothetical protein
VAVISGSGTLSTDVLNPTDTGLNSGVGRGTTWIINQLLMVEIVNRLEVRSLRGISLCYTDDMHQDNFFSIPRDLIIFGISMMLFSNPVLYLMIGAAIIDVKNLFGGSIDRQSISFESSDPLIQGMQFIGALGFLIILYGLWLRNKKRSS